MLGYGADAARRLGLGPLAASVRDVADRFLTRAGWPPLEVGVDGLTLRGYLRHRSFLSLLAAGRYEVFTRRMFDQTLSPGILVVDGGAHIGLYTLLAARRLGPNGHVLAFEPDPHNFRALVLNAARNGLGAFIDARCLALADRCGEMPFHASPGTISGSLVNRPAIGRRRLLTVRTTTVDAELEGAPLQGLLVKLDLEGGESLALRGMHNTLQRARSAVLFLEVNPEALRDAGTSPADLLAELAHLGFRTQMLDESTQTVIPLTRTSHIQKGNLYCTRGV